MTEEERNRRTLEWCRDHKPEWDTYLAKSIAERDAMQQKVDAAFKQGGVRAARGMMRALGYPLPPDELCDPVEELEAKRATSTPETRMRETMAQFGVSEAEAEAVLATMPVGRVDH